jgi:PAS domain S-box-containing protein
MDTPATADASPLPLVTSGSLYREIFASANEAIAVIDLQGRYIEQNAAHRRLLGYDDVDLLGATPAIHMGEEQFLSVVRVLEERRRFQGEVVSVTRDRRRLVIDLTSFTVHDASGRPVCYVGVKRDITERIYARTALEENEEKLRLLIENSGDAILVADDTGRYVEANPAACRMFGLDREALLRLSVSDLVTPDGPSAGERYRAYIETGREAGEFQFVRKDGNVRAVEYSACRFAPGLHLSILRDVTERREMEAARRRSELRFRAIFEQSPMSVQIFAPDGTTVQVNRAWEILWGARLEDLAGYNIRQDRQLEERGVLPLIEKAFGGEPAEIPAIVYNPNETIPGIAQDRDPRRWTRAVIYPVKDEAGVVREVVLTHEDISTRMRAEERLVQNQAHIERLYERLQHAMVETHHRVKNNLQIIAAMIDLEVMEGNDQISVSEFVRLGRHVRSLAIVHELLTAQAKTDGEAHHTSAKEVLLHLLPLLRLTGDSREIHCELEDVQVSSRQATALSLVVNELVSNAMKHGGETVTVALRQKDGRAELVVEDDGPGFAEGFDVNQAAGTGLELVNRLSRWDLQGDVEYVSRAAGGALVRVEFSPPSQRG